MPADGVELVSPVMGTDLPWAAEMNKVWNAVLKSFEIKRHLACGTHVHIKPKDRPYELSELKAIMKGATLYSDAMFRSLNKQRSFNYCQPNHECPKMREFSINCRNAEKSGRPGKLFAWIDSHRKVPCLVQNVCADREVCWNLQPVLKKDKRGTIEFRLPPQVDNMDSALYWIAFTHAFIHHCLNYNFGKAKIFPASSAQLEEAIQSSGQELGLAKYLKKR